MAITVTDRDGQSLALKATRRHFILQSTAHNSCHQVCMHLDSAAWLAMHHSRWSRSIWWLSSSDILFNTVNGSWGHSKQLFWALNPHRKVMRTPLKILEQHQNVNVESRLPVFDHPENDKKKKNILHASARQQVRSHVPKRPILVHKCVFWVSVHWKYARRSSPYPNKMEDANMSVP